MKAKKKQVVGLLINLLEWAIVSMVLSSLIILGDFNVPSSWVYLSSVVVSFLILCVLLGAWNILFCLIRRWRSARKGVPEV